MLHNTLPPASLCLGLAGNRPVHVRIHIQWILITIHTSVCCILCSCLMFAQQNLLLLQQKSSLARTSRYSKCGMFVLIFMYSRSVLKAMYVAWWCAVPEINIWIIDFYCILCWKNGVMGISWIQSTMARVTVHCSEFLQTSTWRTCIIHPDSLVLNRKHWAVTAL